MPRRKKIYHYKELPLPLELERYRDEVIVAAVVWERTLNKVLGKGKLNWDEQKAMLYQKEVIHAAAELYRACRELERVDMKYRPKRASLNFSDYEDDPLAQEEAHTT